MINLECPARHVLVVGVRALDDAIPEETAHNVRSVFVPLPVDHRVRDELRPGNVKKHNEVPIVINSTIKKLMLIRPDTERIRRLNKLYVLW